MRQLIFIILAAIEFCSCISKKNTTIEICNNTLYKIDSVRVLSYGVKEVFKNLNSNEIQKRTVTIKLPADFSKGGFTITIYKKDSVLNATGFGYYSSVVDIKNNYKVHILKDNYSIKEDVE